MRFSSTISRFWDISLNIESLIAMTTDLLVVMRSKFSTLHRAEETAQLHYQILENIQVMRFQSRSSMKKGRECFQSQLMLLQTKTVSKNILARSNLLKMCCFCKNLDKGIQNKSTKL